MFSKLTLTYILLASSFAIRYPRPNKNGSLNNYSFQIKNQASPNINKSIIRSFDHLVDTASADPVCSVLSSGVNNLQIDPQGTLVVDTANKHNPAFKRTWNHILKKIDNKKVLIQLSVKAGDNLTLEQFDESSTLMKTETFATGEFLWNTSDDYFDVGVKACVLEVRGTQMEGPLYPLSETYNNGASEWFFCAQAVIVLVFNPDQVGVDKKWAMQITFENICDGNHPNGKFTTPLLDLTGQLYAIV